MNRTKQQYTSLMQRVTLVIQLGITVNRMTITGLGIRWTPYRYLGQLHHPSRAPPAALSALPRISTKTSPSSWTRQRDRGGPWTSSVQGRGILPSHGRGRDFDQKTIPPFPPKSTYLSFSSCDTLTLSALAYFLHLFPHFHIHCKNSVFPGELSEG